LRFSACDRKTRVIGVIVLNERRRVSEFSKRVIRVFFPRRDKKDSVCHKTKRRRG
jgi:hypothetical protein